jgi:hypothetical protein
MQEMQGLPTLGEINRIYAQAAIPHRQNVAPVNAGIKLSNYGGIKLSSST